MRRLALTAAALAFAAGSAAAEEPHGCDKFKWPLGAERMSLGRNLPVTPNGAEARLGPDAHALTLVPLAAAGLAIAPERNPGGAETRAAFLRVAAPAVAGTVQVTVSEAVWIDLVQGGRFVKPAAFSGALGCPGIRKSVRFPVQAKPFVLQFSGAGPQAVNVVVSSVGGS